MDSQKLDAMQIERIIDAVVPLIAAEEDHEFFRGILYCQAEASRTSADFTYFIASLLNA